jgi:predicted metal-dependent phosphoesterase TrpH
MRLDLHLHTNASDGQHTPAELIEIVRRYRLDAIAITDHDTTDGIDAARRAAYPAPVIITGIEMSAEDEQGDVHILGYCLNPEHAELQRRLHDFRQQRETRGQKIVERLTALGMPIEWARVQAIACDASIGRPHIARALVEAGHVESVRDAFDRYLYNGGPAYVARYRLSPEESIALIHEAGGVAVMAHPALVPDYRAMVQRLLPAGLDGVEVYHPDNNENVRLNLRGMAQQHGLLITGGSDFHGASIKPGIVPGCTNPPPECLARLQERAKQYQ